MSTFFAPELWPFGMAAGLMVAVALVEGLALLLGASLSNFHVDAADHPDGFDGALGWLHFGKVPILVILVIFLTTFALAGFIAQLVARALTGGFMPLLVAALLAFVVAVLGVRVLGAALSRIIPRDETTAVPDASLIGRIGSVVIGTARTGKPAQVRVRDEHGATHYVMVEPEETDQAFEVGVSVLLVRHLGGRRFQAIHNPKPELL